MPTDLTPEDVFGACDAIAVRLENPDSIKGHQVWKVLGRGSKSTVQKHVLRWHKMRNGDVDGQGISVAKLMAEMESGVTRLVESSISGEQDLNRIRAAKDAEEMQTLSSALMSAQIENQRLTNLLEAKSAKHLDSLQRISALENTINRLEGKLELAEKHAAAATEEMAKWAAEGLPEAVRAHAGSQYLAKLLAPRKANPSPDQA